ncbi:MAG: GtrA family protein [Rhodobacter sp.]|nr:GtrA family protein [Paracoccaceae bacterium]MCC0078690.1 GtrA family protein [Rhodobacter sp.]
MSAPRGWALVGRYGAFAVVATLVNLGLQRLVLAALGTTVVQYLIALVLGTGAGLVVKYLLDKRWIFADFETGARAHGRKFTLYTVMGLVTTAIFWASETAFWWVFRTDAARELGAVLGLAVGYVVKYQLDKRFVFTSERADAA